MRMSILTVLAVLLACGTVLPSVSETPDNMPPVGDSVQTALPSEAPDDTPMVDGTVRTFAQVGDTVWLGGNFSEVEQRDGTLVDKVVNVVVFDASTGQYLDIAPELGDEGSTVWDMDVYGDDVVIAGDLSGPSAQEHNLVVVDGTTGAVTRWYDAPVARSVLATPEIGRVYVGGKRLSAFDFEDGKRLWSRAKTTVDQSLRSYSVGPGYRDLELDADGRTIWAACGCDAILAPDGMSYPAKALVKLDIEGAHDTSWVTEAEPEAFGISVVNHGGSLYLAAGGNDFLAQYPKADNGEYSWNRDTSGSAQVVEAMDRQLVVGGHFWEVADESTDDCGHRSSDNAATLDPDNQCQTRKGLAAYSLDGALEPNWDPQIAGKYSLVWALLPEHSLVGPKLHVGGEFLTVDGVRQSNYARLTTR